MKTQELYYDLPQELIAQKPAPNREESRLMLLDRKSGEYNDAQFSDILEQINDGDCLVINDTKVLAARFFARRVSGAKIEGLFLELTEQGLWHVMLKNSRKLKLDEQFILLDTNKKDSVNATMRKRLDDGSFLIEVASPLELEQLLQEIGFAPLPPYIKRPDGGSKPQEDISRYQTVFARETGAIAAPTAGLHFSEQLLKRITDKGVRIAHVTLHVGAGTFKPVTVENLEDHDIHSERYSLDQENAGIINEVKNSGGRIIAVGTTSVRTLETIARSGKIEAKSGDTRLFITPGFQYRAVDAMVTNFHLPNSTLLALVGAFAGMDNVMAAYAHAVRENYRFFSYGDAMFIS